MELNKYPMVILITGASKGIGNFLATQLVLKGYTVYGTYNSTEPELNNGFSLNKVDVSNYEQVKLWIQSLQLRNKKIVLINAAGITYNSFTHKADPDKWLEVINVNLFGSFNTSRYILPMMRKENFGRIINISSVVAQLGVNGTSAYAASKAALWGLSKALAAENATKGITVNSLTLGYFNIGMINEIPEELQKSILNKIPQQKFGEPGNIISAIEFLIKSDYTTGANIDINGGIY